MQAKMNINSSSGQGTVAMRRQEFFPFSLPSFLSSQGLVHIVNVLSLQAEPYHRQLVRSHNEVRDLLAHSLRFFKIICIFYVCVCIYHMPEGTFRGQMGESDPLKRKLQVVVNCPKWVLGINSQKTPSTRKH